jgi:hypothetical protein
MEAFRYCVSLRFITLYCFVILCGAIVQGNKMLGLYGGGINAWSGAAREMLMVSAPVQQIPIFMEPRGLFTCS